MLRKMDKNGRFENFLLPFDGKLKKNNRWVKLADAILEQIMKNPYLQYFLGYEEFQDKAPFDASTLVYFRTRFELEDVNDIKETAFLSLSEPGQYQHDACKIRLRP